ncbi:hypothetical protein FHX75_121337 [Micromonospora palomenae]|uniref:DUF3885 domain-containing protein n=1 Tax=Micromonospora palomenae TaxID=1461247 RepID=A0A561WG61_9ACTN|nr:hypothetical protein [Micromonospora palomenae]TWG22801.1 hypothetical protein FHX75_121337 [Micromonospora palomenae]
MTQRWATLAEIGAARDRFERELRWRRPVLHGIGFPSVDLAYPRSPEDICFLRVNGAGNVLPAAVLATVVGWHGGTGSVRVTQEQLGRAIELLAPAEACTDVPHPNLAVWREVYGWSWGDDGEDLVAVFDADPDEPTDDPYVRTLREVAASGRQDVPKGEVRFWPQDGGGELRAAWEARWPQLPPIFRSLPVEPERWVRFHSLPGSKRYADTDEEYATILHRHDTVLAELGATDLVVITVEVLGTPTPGRRQPVLAELLPEAECWSVFSWPDLEPELCFGHAYASRVDRRSVRLAGLLRRVADDEVDHVIIAPPDLSWLYAPYDGGADVLLPTREGRDELRERHPDWLSAHPSGW